MLRWIPPGNDFKNPASGVEYTGKALAWLGEHQLPAVLISSRRVQRYADARELAEKYGAGYRILAGNLRPIIEKLLRERSDAKH